MRNHVAGWELDRLIHVMVGMDIAVIIRILARVCISLSLSLNLELKLEPKAEPEPEVKFEGVAGKGNLTVGSDEMSSCGE